MNYGEFVQGGAGYQINTPHTPAKWFNYLFNDEYWLDVSQTLQGQSRFVENYNAKAFCTGFRQLFINDGGKIIEPLAARCQHDNYSCTHYLGYSEVNALNGEIISNVRVCVPSSGKRETWQITVTNNSKNDKALSLFWVVPFENSGPMGGECRYVKNDGYLYKYSFPYHVYYDDKAKVENNIAYYYMFSDKTPSAFDGSTQRFYGEDDVNVLPAAVKNGRCSNVDGEGERSFVGAFQYDFNLKPLQSFTVNISIGAARSISEIVEVKSNFNPLQDFSSATNMWEQRLNSYHVNTSDANLNALMNFWFKKQVTFLARLNRTSVCCPVRNQLQDAFGYSLVDPRGAFKLALDVVKLQRADGFLQQWHMTDNSAPRGLCLLKHGDGGLWLIICLIEIINQCKDISLYDLLVPFADGTTATVREHLLRAAWWYAENYGPNGLCLMLDGDWTDPINGAGRNGVGESAWSSMTLLYCYKKLSAIVNEHDKAKLAKLAANLELAINNNLWDGDWYVCGIDDNGNPYGSHADVEGQIFLNAQTWAIISGAAVGEKLDKSLKAIDKLSTPFGYRLVVPPFTKWNPTWGRISVKQIGTTENGSVYCHGSMFKAFADIVRGDKNAALQTVLDTLPTNPKNSPEINLQVPLFVPNYYFGLENVPNFGRSSLNYETGTVAWLVWLVVMFLAEDVNI